MVFKLIVFKILNLAHLGTIFALKCVTYIKVLLIFYKFVIINR